MPKCQFDSKIECPITLKKYSEREQREMCLFCETNPQTWYEKHVEPEIQPLVKLLRNNGLNTTCSCGHEMYCECDVVGNYFETAHFVSKLLTKHDYEQYKVECSYGIDAAGQRYKCLTVWLPKPNGFLSKLAHHFGSE